jgi:glucose-6-phosphate-specific signal transduction histidine kinase
MPTAAQLKNLLVTLACCIAAYLSFTFYGGYLVFGFRSFAEFCFVVVPVLVLPIALLGFRYPWASAVLTVLIMALFFGVQLWELGPPWSRVLHNGTQFFKFLFVALLISGAAVLQYIQRRTMPEPR